MKSKLLVISSTLIMALALMAQSPTQTTPPSTGDQPKTCACCSHDKANSKACCGKDGSCCKDGKCDMLSTDGKTTADKCPMMAKDGKMSCCGKDGGCCKGGKCDVAKNGKSCCDGKQCTRPQTGA